MKINYWLAPGIKKREREILVWEAINEVAVWYEVDGDMIRSKETGRGTRKWNQARYIVYHLMNQYSPMTQKAVAEYFGVSLMTVCRGAKKVRDKMVWDGELKDCVEWCEFRLLGSEEGVYKGRRV